AEVVGVRTGAAGLVRVIERLGLDQFRQCVVRMYEHGEAMVRSYFEKIPDGRYVGHGEMDDNGVETDPVPFEVVVEGRGSQVTVAYSSAPPTQAGPINCPRPSTVSASRIAISMLAGGGEAPNDGHFRAIEVITKPNTLFHPLSPAPCFLYGWPGDQPNEGIYRAISDAMP